MTATAKRRVSEKLFRADRNAVTGLMKGMGYGKNYQYAHDFDSGVAPDQTYLPDRLKGRRYYIPRPLGAEPELSKRVRPDSDQAKRQQKQ